MWNLKNSNIEHCISWEVFENSDPYNTTSKKVHPLYRRKILYVNWETNFQQKKGDFRSMSAPAETSTTKHGRWARHGRVYSAPEDSG